MSITPPPEHVWVHLDIPRALQQVGDMESLQEMLPMLQELLDRDVERIRQLLAAGDVRAANELLHALKGCMPIFCTPVLCEQLAQVEFLSKTASADVVAEAYAVLNPKLKELQQEIVKFLA